MAYKTAFPLKGHRNSGVVVFSGSFKPNAGSAVDNTANTGAGFTVAYTGVGIFTITLDDSYVRCLSATATVSLSAVANTFVQWGAIDVTTAKTLVINVLTAGVAANIAANAANRIHFSLVLQDTSVTP